MNELSTPYYLVDEARLVHNLEIARTISEHSGAAMLLALKCFSTWSVFPLVRQYLAGTTSSSVNEARLGHETFGGETHAYSVAFTPAEVAEVAGFADTIVFNSASQLRSLRGHAGDVAVGVRVNPGLSHSNFDLADPARRFSRLGIVDPDELRAVADSISGVMFHFNCENEDLDALTASLEVISDRFGDVLDRVAWVSLGGGISFTAPGYPIHRFADVLRGFAERHGVRVILEPGEAVVTGTAELITTVLDVVHNEVDVAIVDASIEAHLLDHLIYRTTPRVSSPGPGPHRTLLAGRTCLAGDVFGEHALAEPMRVGTEVRFADAAGYTMVKATWFNGVPRPAIVVRRLDGSIDVVREFGYADFRDDLS